MLDIFGIILFVIIMIAGLVSCVLMFALFLGVAFGFITDEDLDAANVADGYL